MAEPKRSDTAVTAVSEQEPLIGRVLDGRYRIDERLGAGGVGAVYRGTQLALGRSVAIKILLEGVHPSFTQRFEREAKALASLRHPNIVAVTDYGVSEDMPFLVMELLEGETLAYHLMQGRMQPHAVLVLARQLLRALTFVHEQGLVHRDLKPGNVFLEKTQEGGRLLKLLDFGLAKFVQGQSAIDDPPVTRAGDIVGTPAYIAPEQVAGDAIDPRTDTYALGVMLFQMLSGRVPFEGEPVEQLKSHLVSPVPALRDKNPSLQPRPELERLLQRAMAKQRDARFQTSAEMLAALEAIPMPWLTASKKAGKTDALASTVLSPAPEPPEGRTELHQAGPSDTQVIRHVRVLGNFALTIFSSAAIALAIFLLVLRDRQAGEAGDAARDSATIAASPRPSAPRSSSQARPAPPKSAARPPAGTSQSATGIATAITRATSSAPEISAPQLQPPAQREAARSQRPPAYNPWARGTPSDLRSLRKAILAGERGNDRAIMLLRRYNRGDGTDARGHLLLAQLYMNRLWRADAVNQYATAYQVDPGARGTPDMLRNLLKLVAEGGSSAGDAARLVREAYGPEALPAVDRTINALREHAAARARMTALRSSIAGL